MSNTVETLSYFVRFSTEFTTLPIEINPQTGEVSITGNLDYEVNPQHIIRVSETRNVTVLEITVPFDLSTKLIAKCIIKKHTSPCLLPS